MAILGPARDQIGSQAFITASTAGATRSRTIGQPLRIPSKALFPIGESRSKPACSKCRHVPLFPG